MQDAARTTHVPPARRSPEGGAGGPRGGGGRGQRRGGHRRRRGKHRILKWTAITLSLLVLGTAGVGWLYYRHLNGNIRKDDLTLGQSMIPHKKNAAGQTAMNILLIGSDSRKSKEDQKLGGARQDADRPPLADVQMLVHLSADRTNASVISIPRDTRVDIPKCVDKDGGQTFQAAVATINQTLGRGGPGCTVATWYQLTGIPIDHFMMLDFSGVVKMADAVGGVPVCVDANIYSKDSLGHGSGLRLAKGTHRVKGVQALQWLRTRYGFEDNTDIGRTHAQHMYMNSLFRQLKSGTKLTDPGQLMALAEASTKALTVDKGLGNVRALYALGQQLKKIPPKHITMTTMPWVWDPQNAAHVIPKAGDADKLFSLVRDDVPLDGQAVKKATSTPKSDVPDGEIEATVVNGTGSTTFAPVSGRATQIAGVLASKGFTKATAANTLDPQDETMVEYPEGGHKGQALAVAKALGLPQAAVDSSQDVTRITVVVGGDWRTGTVYPVAEKEKRDSRGVPGSAAVLHGDNTKACMHVNPNYTW
jgi:LCP family protein required for cell wall assembly